MKRHLAILVAIAALAIGVAADATSGRVPVVNRVTSTRMSTLANLPGLKWWVKPSGIVAGDATNVDSWTDSSGNGNTITETGTNRPTVVTSALSGANGVQFVTANSQRLKKTNTALLTTGQVSFFMVLRVDALPGTSNDIFLANSVAGTTGFEFGRVGSSNKFNPSYAGGSGTAFNVMTTGTFHTIVYHSNGQSNATFRYDRVNQSSTSYGIGFIIPTGTASLILGSRPNLLVPASITVIEAGLVDGELTTTETEFIETYEKTTYPALP